MEIASNATGSTETGAGDSTAADGPTDGFHWTAGLIARAVALFLVAGVAEIGGGWLIWQTGGFMRPPGWALNLQSAFVKAPGWAHEASREHKAWWMALLGCVVLIAYGFIPTAQPTDNFGRIFAVYGGFFIVLSYLWGWAVDGVRPDVGDWVGTAVAIVGVCIAMFWRR